MTSASPTEAPEPCPSQGVRCLLTLFEEPWIPLSAQPPLCSGSNLSSPGKGDKNNFSPSHRNVVRRKQNNAHGSALKAERSNTNVDVSIFLRPWKYSTFCFQFQAWEKDFYFLVHLIWTKDTTISLWLFSCFKHLAWRSVFVSKLPTHRVERKSKPHSKSGVWRWRG